MELALSLAEEVELEGSLLLQLLIISMAINR